MENSSNSSSSSTKDLFGSKESSTPSSSTGIFASIFPPPSMAVGRSSSGMEFSGTNQKQYLGNQAWGSRQGTSENISKHSEGSSIDMFNKERRSIFQKNLEPCPLSSSLYYGGQEDMYIDSSSPQTSGSQPLFKNDGKEDTGGSDPHSASRGNWWKGSLYY